MKKSIRFLWYAEATVTVAAVIGWCGIIAWLVSMIVASATVSVFG